MSSDQSVPAPSETDAKRDLTSLNIRVEPFTEEHLPLVQAFSERYWSRPRTAAFYRWRYLESLPFSRMFLARTDDECLGMVYAFEKRYRIRGVPTTCLEIFDWHSLPGLSGSGIGIRVIRALTRLNVRLLGIGGTPEATKALPVMGWQTLASAVTYELPLSGEFLVDGLRRRVPFRIPGERLALDTLVGAWFTPRRRTGHGRVVPVAMLGSDVDALYDRETGYDLIQTPHQQWLRWLTAAYPGTGSFRFCYFTSGDQLRGWALTRVYDTTRGREAAIVDVYAPSPDVDTYTWMISELAASLSGEQPLAIRARATCPLLQTALKNNRFRAGDAVPVFTWPKMTEPVQRPHITLNHTDACLRPYLTTAANDGAAETP
jgi:hypothetical protein